MSTTLHFRTLDFAFTAESAFFFHPVPRRSKSSNVLNRPQPYIRVLRTNNAKGRLRTLDDLERLGTGRGQNGDGTITVKEQKRCSEIIVCCLGDFSIFLIKS